MSIVCLLHVFLLCVSLCILCFPCFARLFLCVSRFFFVIYTIYLLHNSMCVPCLKIYVFGGVGDNAYYNDVWALDILSAQWTRVETTGASPKARFSHTACLTGTDVLIYGGYNSLPHTCLVRCMNMSNHAFCSCRHCATSLMLCILFHCIHVGSRRKKT